jgi:hypothetical protein
MTKSNVPSFALFQEGGKEPGIVIYGTKDGMLDCIREMERSILMMESRSGSRSTGSAGRQIAWCAANGMEQDWIMFSVLSDSEFESMNTQISRSEKRWCCFKCLVAFAATLLSGLGAISIFSWFSPGS